VDAERVTLIMESFADWHSPDQVAGATAEEVTTATETLAGLTATFWNKPIREQHPWIRNMHSEVFANMPSEYLDNIEGSMNHIGDALPANAEETARKIGDNFDGLMSHFTEGPQVLSHWDYRVENFFYGPDREFVVIDWQLMMTTRPGADLAYLLCTNIETELRREIESDLMDLYLEGLHRAGVENYSRNDLERDYRFAMLPVSSISIIGGASVDVTNLRSHALVKAMGRRLFQAIEDWDAVALLP
jgi:thiamine kinase-like enzyme